MIDIMMLEDLNKDAIIEKCSEIINFSLYFFGQKRKKIHYICKKKLQEEKYYEMGVAVNR